MLQFLQCDISFLMYDSKRDWPLHFFLEPKHNSGVLHILPFQGIQFTHPKAGVPCNLDKRQFQPPAFLFQMLLQIIKLFFQLLYDWRFSLLNVLAKPQSAYGYVKKSLQTFRTTQ